MQDSYVLLHFNVTCGFTRRTSFSSAHRRAGGGSRRRALSGETTAPGVPRGASQAGGGRERRWPRLAVRAPAPARPSAAPAGAAMGTSIGGRQSGTVGFRSPIPSPRSCPPSGASEEALRCEIEELKRKDLALDQEIAELLSEGYTLEELEQHISLLHEYNDIKDAGQMLLGKLAVIRGVTTKELYPEYDLELSD
ncbi:DNA repair protein SWI5 homolog [Pogoniulus pusillus]|uniref:DNA repair protein SWI5 homolog n=1 Tax=Pogoniulus pusillus TaxID=488313 RepID=UPI0030B95BDA